MSKKLTQKELKRTLDVLKECDGNKTAAAKILGVNYTTLYYRLRRIREKGIKEDRIEKPIEKNKRSEEDKIGLLWKDREKNKAILIRYYQYLVYRIAGKIKRKLTFIDKDDLIQAGNLGLLDAFESYDLSRGKSFPVYSYNRIKGEMLDFLRREDYQSRKSREQIKEKENAIEFLTKQLGYAPSDEILLEYLGWSGDDYAYFVGLNNRPISVEEKSNNGWRDLRLEEILVDKIKREGRFEEDETVREMLKGLSLEEVIMVYLYFWKEITMREIGQVLRLSESRISQAMSEIFKRMRHREGLKISA